MKDWESRKAKRGWEGWGISMLYGIFLLAALGCGKHSSEAREVVLYCSQDQVYAEPLLREFEEFSGIRVKAVFDSEAVKTASLAQRLIAEKDRPKGDVFWSNEEFFFRSLVDQGVVEEGVPIGSRSRRLVANPEFVSPEEAPASLEELLLPKWKDKVVMAYPMFGTTLLHMIALNQRWRDDWEQGVVCQRFRNWCEGMLENGLQVVDGNASVVRVVGRGTAWLGLTDSDDILVGLRQNWPIKMLPYNPELIRIPNMVGKVVRRPNAPEADVLVQFLTRSATANRLVEWGGLESADIPSAWPDYEEIAWSEALDGQEALMRYLKEVFLR